MPTAKLAHVDDEGLHIWVLPPLKQHQLHQRKQFRKSRYRRDYRNKVHRFLRLHPTTR